MPSARSSSRTAAASGRTRSRAPTAPRTAAVAGHEQRRLPAGVEPVQHGRRLRRQGDALFFQQPAVADDQRSPPAVRAVTPAPGWARNSSTGSGVSPRRAASCTMSRASGCSLRCSAVAAARSTSSAVDAARAAIDVAEFEPALGERAGLVEGEGVDARPAVPGPSRP